MDSDEADSKDYMDDPSHTFLKASISSESKKNVKIKRGRLKVGEYELLL